jgi:hypothetical protein
MADSALAGVICAGCGKKAEILTPEEQEIVLEDSSYSAEQKKYVCDFCYCHLIQMSTPVLRYDLGSAEILIRNAEKLLKFKN